MHLRRLLTFDIWKHIVIISRCYYERKKSYTRFAHFQRKHLVALSIFASSDRLIHVENEKTIIFVIHTDSLQQLFTQVEFATESD